jgi:haloalkane dehalogenase
MQAATGEWRPPAWLDQRAYPFDHHFFDAGPGRLHYVDEGEGRPVLFLHGNPTWSFLYRHLVDGLSDGYRCIAPDYLGFGLSEKPTGWSYRPSAHAVTIERLVADLDVEDVVLVVHDWGGPIGASFAAGHPEKVAGFVVMNSWTWPLDDWRPRAFSRALGGRVGRYLIRERNLFADRVMRAAFADDATLARVHDQYLRPLATPDDRQGSWVFPRELTGSRSWLETLWRERDRFAGKPALLAWGTRDIAFGTDDLRLWQALFPDADTLRFDVGHYVAEEVGPALAEPVWKFLDGL